MPVYHKSAIRYSRDERKQQIIGVLYQASKKKSHPVEMTAHDLARSLQLQNTSYVRTLCRELTREGELTERKALHRPATVNRFAVYKRLYSLVNPPASFAGDVVQKELL